MTEGNKPAAIAKLTLPGGKVVDLPTMIGTEQEPAINITKLRSETGYIALDPGLRNTGTCTSEITFIDGEKGVLRYRGIPIEQLAAHSTFLETALLLIDGELPNRQRLTKFRALSTQHEMLHEGLRNAFDGFPANAHPMAILSAMINAVSCYHPDVMKIEGDVHFDSAAARLISKVRTIAAAAYKTSIGQPITYPRPDYTYVRNFLHMMFSLPFLDHEADEDTVAALELILILHADHEQNCSTSTVRMVGSSGASLFASCAAGVCALWGWRHGGANAAVIDMLQTLHEQKADLGQFIERVRNREALLMGFGHRVYKNYDPRAKILKAAADRVLAKLHKEDPLLDIARKLEEIALSDNYFLDRKLYPNVDFYSGIILRAIGLPVSMFSVMFAIGRMPGWIAHWRELQKSEDDSIYRPRQIYTGATERDYVPMERRQ